MLTLLPSLILLRPAPAIFFIVPGSPLSLFRCAPATCPFRERGDHRGDASDRCGDARGLRRCYAQYLPHLSFLTAAASGCRDQQPAMALFLGVFRSDSVAAVTQRGKSLM
jgi:hypothetical protein